MISRVIWFLFLLSLVLRADGGPVTITTTSLPNGIVQKPYSGTLTAIADKTPLTWSVSAGSLPPGLSVSDDGKISGKPTNAGTFIFTVKAVDTKERSDTQQLSILITSPVTIQSISLPDGQVGAPYSQSMSATGGQSPYSWSVTSGAPPAGLTLGATGQISGTPTIAGLTSFSAKAIDTNGSSDNKTVSITVAPSAVQIKTTFLPSGEVGVAYSQSLQATGGKPPYTWTISSGTMPSGVTLRSSGQISGTPANAGTANFSLKATDANGASDADAFSLTILAAVQITTASLPDGQIGAAYSQSLQATGGAGPYTWSIASGSLPAGLTLSSTGQIAGTSTTTGTANFTVKITDENGGSDTQALTLSIAPPPLKIVPPTLRNGTVGAAYSESLQATGGTPPYNWAIAAGSLPQGLSLSAGGAISGVPRVAGTASFSVKVTDSTSASATANLSLIIIAGVSIGSCPAGSGTVGQAYSASLNATGGTPPYSWSLASGQLPAGLNLDPQRGQIAGTPTAAGGASFTLKATDSVAATATQPCSINISASVPPLTIITVSLPDAVAGVQYSRAVTASGGQQPYSWSIAGGSLPPSVTLDSAGQISGTPAAPGLFEFTVRVSDSAGGHASRDLMIRVGAGLSIASCSSGTATVGQPYSGTMTASGGMPPYAWSISSPPPAGLVLDRASGALTGTPTQAGPVTFGVVVTDSSSGTAAKTCAINVTAVLSVTTSSLVTGTTGVAFTQQLSASGGAPPYTWSLTSGSLPGAVSLSTSGVISGVPAASGTFAIVVRVTDTKNLSADRPLTLVITASLQIGCPTGTAVTGQQYSSTPLAAGGQPPYTWSSSNIPPGLSLSSAGVISGIPTASGTFSYILTVTDKNGAAATQQCSLSVATNLTILTPLIADASQLAPYSQSLSAMGGNAPYLWSLFSGSLPSGIVLDATGLISGSPSQIGTFNFTLRVTDSAGVSAQKAFSMSVAAGLVVAVCPAAVTEVGLPFNSALAASGGVQPYSWTISAGSLPSGLTIDSAGIISGSGTKAAVMQFTLLATDAANRTATRQCVIDVRAAPAISSGSLAPGSTGTPYSDTVAASGGVPPYVWITTAGSLPPGLSLNAATGEISGKAVLAGNFGFTLQLIDNIGGETSKDLSITIAQGLAIADCPTPIGSIGQRYSATLTAIGGIAPYLWSLSAGALPPGLSLDAPNSLISGLPSEPGPSSYTLQVADSAGKLATRACSIQINSATLTITSAGALPDALTGASYSKTFGAAGGRPPYSWSIVSAGAPAGFSLDASGLLTGVSSTPGNFTFTVQVTDQDNNVARRSFALNVLAGTPPNVTITGLPDIVDPAQQPTFNIQLDSTYPADITGAVILSFTPDPVIGIDDPTVQFATSGRRLPFTVPANSKNPVFSAPILALQTGTVAGNIQLSVTIQSNGSDITPANSSVRTIRLDRRAPKVVSLSIVRTSTGFDVRLIGFSTTREVTQGTFRFLPANSAQPFEVAVPMADSSRSWFESTQSAQFGGQFSLIQPFTLSAQSINDFSSVSITLSNAQGNSDTITARF